MTQAQQDTANLRQAQITIGSVHKLTFSDWFAIAVAAGVNNPQAWALHRWVENSNELDGVSRKEIHYVAEQVDYSPSYVMRKVMDGSV